MTMDRIEEACSAFSKSEAIDGPETKWPGDYSPKEQSELRLAMTAAIAAADAVVSDDSEALIADAQDYIDKIGHCGAHRPKAGEVVLALSADGMRRLLALSRRGAGVVPAGFKLVPVEITHEIHSAMFSSVGDDEERSLCCLGDLIDISPNKLRLALKAAYEAAVSASPPSAMLTEAEVRADERYKAEMDARYRLRVAFRKAVSELPEIAPLDVSTALSAVHMTDEFHREGKRLQAEHGRDAVAPRVEQECAAGAWSFMRNGLLAAIRSADAISKEDKP